MECFSPLFESVVIHHKSLTDEFVEDTGRPLAEAGCFCGIDSIADRDDSIEIIEFHELRNFATESSIYDCFHFGNSRITAKFSLVVDIFEMFTDSWHLNPKELRHGLLCKPYCFILHNSLNLPVAIGKIVEKKLDGGMRHFLIFGLSELQKGHLISDFRIQLGRLSRQLVELRHECRHLLFELLGADINVLNLHIEVLPGRK